MIPTNGLLYSVDLWFRERLVEDPGVHELLTILVLLQSPSCGYSSRFREPQTLPDPVKRIFIFGQFLRRFGGTNERQHGSSYDHSPHRRNVVDVDKVEDATPVPQFGAVVQI